MERLWNFLMRANAKGLFMIALLVLIGVALWRGWIEVRAATQAPVEEKATSRVEFKPGNALGLIDYANEQLAWSDAPPEDPFLPTLEALGADPSAIDTLRNRSERNRDWNKLGGTTTSKDPFAHLRGSRSLPVADNMPTAQQPGTTRLTYKGFFKGPDGLPAAFFHDSASNSMSFKGEGATLYGATLVEANLRHVVVRLPDDSEVILERNEFIDLKMESATHE